MGNKVVLGLSGGVDSAVAALLLQQQGFEVIGLYLDNGLPGRDDAARAAEGLRIPLIVRDVRALMEERVCAPFAEGYLRGETPNPCILCNPAVKFFALLEEMERQGADHMATGHYAGARDGIITRGREENDQSYMLCRLSKEQTGRLLLPLGGYKKTEVRSMAEEAGLSSAHKPDSMDICFIPDGDYAAWIESRGIRPPEGDFLLEGQVVGRHRGIHHYTVGQGRHLGQGFGKKVWVSAIDREKNRVILSGDPEKLMSSAVFVRGLHFLQPPEGATVSCGVRIRHSRGALPVGELRISGTEGVITMETPVRAPTPGQTAAFYLGDVLLGGGFITGDPNLSERDTI